LAKLGENSLWICSKSKEKFDTLTPQETAWLERDSKDHRGHVNVESASIHIDSTPTLRELAYLKHCDQRINVIECVAPRWKSVADQLHLKSHHIETIEMESLCKPGPACREMFAKWLKGFGRKPITWRTVIDALDDAGLPTVSLELNTVINGTQENQFHETSLSTSRRRAKCCCTIC
jgi:hypothetical protein